MVQLIKPVIRFKYVFTYLFTIMTHFRCNNTYLLENNIKCKYYPAQDCRACFLRQTRHSVSSSTVPYLVLGVFSLNCDLAAATPAETAATLTEQFKKSRHPENKSETKETKTRRCLTKNSGHTMPPCRMLSNRPSVSYY